MPKASGSAHSAQPPRPGPRRRERVRTSTAVLGATHKNTIEATVLLAEVRGQLETRAQARALAQQQAKRRAARRPDQEQRLRLMEAIAGLQR